MHITFDLIINTLFTYSIPVWSAFIGVIFAYCLLHWNKNVSRLQMKGKPEPFNISYDTFEVRWQRPRFVLPDSYTVYLRKASEPEKWTNSNTINGECSLKISDLSPNTEYIVCVCAHTRTETGPVGCESDVITTKNLAFKLKQKSTLLPADFDIPHSLPVYAVKYEAKEDNDKKIKRIIIGEALEDSCTQTGKSILIFSTPHSGKATLVQGLMNFILGVSPSDGYRLRFAPELTRKTDLYQDWVTVYEFQEFKGGRIDYPLTIIDIPRLHLSTKEDILKLRDQIRSYQSEFDCICFVTQANMFSLPVEEIESIQFIKDLFQTDLNADVCCCFFTFADLGPAQVKKVFEVNDIRVIESYLVNFSCLFQQIDNASKVFWDSNVHGLNNFLEHLQTTVQKILLGNKDSDFLTLNNLLSQIENLQPEVNADLAKLGEIKIHTKTMTDHRDEILSTGDFEYQIEEIKQTKEELQPGRHVTNCTVCFYTCHKNCGIKDDAQKMGCVAMENGYCKKCTDRCVWSVHTNTPYIYHYTSTRVTKSYNEMKTSYETQHGQTLDFDDYLDHLNKDMEELIARLRDKVKRINEYRNAVKGIKKSHVGGTFDCTIDDLIKSEQIRKNKGYERRIEMFQELKDHKEMIQIVKNK